MCQNQAMPFLLPVGTFVVAAALSFFGAQTAPLMLGNGPGTINQLSPFVVSGGEVRVASTTADFRVPSLSSCNTIDTDSNGVFACGTDASGGGGGGSISTSSALANTQVGYATGVDTIASDPRTGSGRCRQGPLQSRFRH